jgi:hypothetical protein
MSFRDTSRFEGSSDEASTRGRWPARWYRSHAGYACVPQYQVKMNAGNPRSGMYLLCRETRESGLKWPTVRTISTKVTGKGHYLLFLVRIARPRSCRESPVCEDKHPWKERDTCCALPQKLIQHVPISHGHSRIATTEDDSAHDGALSPCTTINDENTWSNRRLCFTMPVTEEFEQDQATGSLTRGSFESLGPFRASMARNGEW